MGNREKIIQLFKNPLVTGYGMEIMSNGRLYSANFQIYKNRVKTEENLLIIFESMTEKVEQVFLELAYEYYFIFRAIVISVSTYPIFLYNA